MMDWQKVCDYSGNGLTQSDVTERLRVEGGWLYRTMLYAGSSASVAMVFVPEVRTDQLDVPHGVNDTQDENRRRLSARPIS